MQLLTVIAIAMLVMGMVVSQVAMDKKTVKQLRQSHGAYDRDIAVQGFADRRGMEAAYSGSQYRDPAKEGREELEMIESALVRACTSVSTLAHDNGCLGWGAASNVWQFVGTAGNKASLDPSWTGTTSLTFTCTSFQNGTYGRYLIQNALPSAHVVGKGYQYDFTGMSDTHVDPCGYAYIVGK